MIRAFVDASVLYAALISSSGAARELLKRHVANEIDLVVSDYVIEEVRRNLAKKAPDLVGALDLVLDLVAFERVVPAREQIQLAATYTALKDAPVVAAAQAATCPYLLTFDKQHLLTNEVVAERAGIKVRTPGNLLHQLRHDDPP